MRPSLSGILVVIVFVLLGIFFLNAYRPQTGGDIVEYFGITQSLRSHGAVWLSENDQTQLERILPVGYFSDPGYYIQGSYARRYPVHFVGYSFLLLPFVIVLELIGKNPLLVFAAANTFFAAWFVLWMIKRFTRTTAEAVILLGCILFSPLSSFFIWPGPDILVMLALTASVFLFGERKYGWAAVIVALASWHSQPLAPLAALFAVLHLSQKEDGHFSPSRIPLVFLAGSIALLPYVFNLYAFRTVTPWTLLKDPWTIRNGFGLHNASLKKLTEQFFDPNIGAFWYIPALAIAGVVGWWKTQNVNPIHRLIPFAVLATAVFYQTNPAWNYGTSGFGPSRHALFLVPFSIYYTFTWISSLNTIWFRNVLFILIIGVQAFCLSINGWLTPRLSDTLEQSPFAAIILNRFPKLYEPTPEIFVDRSTHLDVPQLTTAIYKYNGVCKKAFVTPDGYKKLVTECGYIPESVTNGQLTGEEGFYVTY